MDISPPLSADRQIIQGYGGGGFRVSGVRYRGSILVLPGRTLAWSLVDIQNLEVQDLYPVRDGTAAGLLLIGCGRDGAFIPAKLRSAVRAWDVVIEAMGTGAACRTYNVLLSENRDVAAALIAMD